MAAAAPAAAAAGASAAAASFSMPKLSELASSSSATSDLTAADVRKYGFETSFYTALETAIGGSSFEGVRFVISPGGVGVSVLPIAKLTRAKVLVLEPNAELRARIEKKVADKKFDIEIRDSTLYQFCSNTDEHQKWDVLYIEPVWPVDAKDEMLADSVGLPIASNAKDAKERGRLNGWGLSMCLLPTTKVPTVIVVGQKGFNAKASLAPFAATRSAPTLYRIQDLADVLVFT